MRLPNRGFSRMSRTIGGTTHFAATAGINRTVDNCMSSETRSKTRILNNSARHLATSPNRGHPPESAIATLAHDVRMYKAVSGDMIKQKWHQAYSFYEQFSHMDEVREAHDKVVAIQTELQQAQQRRCDAAHELNAVRKELQLIFGEMANVDRRNVRYKELVNIEFEINQREREFQDAFQLEDQRERNLFTHLTAAVKASHEKEKIYANTVKYWSIIGSILGAMLGVAGSALSYHYRQNTYKTITDNYTEQVVQIEAHIQQLHAELGSLRHEIEASRVIQQRALDVLAAANVRSTRAIATRTANALTEGVQVVGESWSSYLYRKTVGLYRWVYPRATTVVK